MLRNQQGITLVALVVTIVILIILATISISIVMQGGLIDRSVKAKELYENQQNAFNEIEGNTVNYIDDTLKNAGINITKD